MAQFVVPTKKSTFGFDPESLPGKIQSFLGGSPEEDIMGLAGPMGISGNRGLSRAQELDRALQIVKQRFPGLSLQDLRVQQGTGPGGAEIFPPSELLNPNPGVNTIEVRSQDSGSRLESLIATEAIQLLSISDPEIKSLKTEFRRSLTPRQLESSMKRFEKTNISNRNFDQFIDQIYLDASIRAIMFPELVTDPGYDPAREFTPEQFKIVDKVVQRLKRQ